MCSAVILYVDWSIGVRPGAVHMHLDSISNSRIQYFHHFNWYYHMASNLTPRGHQTRSGLQSHLKILWDVLFFFLPWKSMWWICYALLESAVWPAIHPQLSRSAPAPPRGIWMTSGGYHWHTKVIQCHKFVLTLSMLKLLLSKAQGRKDFWKPS